MVRTVAHQVSEYRSGSLKYFFIRSLPIQLKIHFPVQYTDKRRTARKEFPTGSHNCPQCAIHTGLRDLETKGILRVGASITIGSQFLPGYVKAFSGPCPGIDVRAPIDQGERLEKKLLDNELEDTTQIWAKVPSQALSDMLIQALKDGYSQEELVGQVVEQILRGKGII